jgi:hypothetical protein
MVRPILLAALLAAASSTANAAIVTIAAEFHVTDWTINFNNPSASPGVRFLSYSVTFDDTLDYDSDASVLTIVDSNIPFPISFSRSGGSPFFNIASNGSPNGCNVAGGAFCAIFDYPGNGIPPSVLYGMPDGSGSWRSEFVNNGLPRGGAVPEPASWAMLITGFGLVGAAQRRRAALAA